MDEKQDFEEAAATAIDQTRPLGVYVHFPFCTTRCPYCDFAVSVKREIPHEAYADAVLAELQARARGHKGESGPTLVSVYFGGGTPGLWRARALGRVLEGVTTTFGESSALEITVETNPGDLDASHLADLRALGVNRLSVGAQAFQEQLLRTLGRHHAGDDIPRTFEAARVAGFDNLCADLMFGLPGQSMEDWHASLDALCALGPSHITAYSLTVEPGTRFGVLERAGKLPRPSDDEVADMYRACQDRLARAGYEHYEISSYALPGRRSRHNTLYWTMGAYLGLGVSAASFMPLRSGAGIRRTNPRSLPAYLDVVKTGSLGALPDGSDALSLEELEMEALWLGLRTSDGVNRPKHRLTYGHDPLALPGRQEAARRCIAAGWLEVSEAQLRLSAAGFLFADEVTVRLWNCAPAGLAKSRF